MFDLFVDSDCDIIPQQVKEYGFKLISMPYIVDGEMFYPYKDSDTFDFKAFYDMLRGGVIPKTASINEAEYIQYFEPSFKEGRDVLYIHFSRAMSGTFDGMDRAVKSLLETYPDRKFIAVDTKCITVGALNILLFAGDLFKQGLPMEEIADRTRKIIDNVATYFFASNLKFFAQSGRISNFAAFMGGMVNLKAVIHINDEGQMKNIGKCRGTLPTLNKLVGYMEEKEVDLNQRIIIAHSDDLENAKILESLIVKKFGDNLKISYACVNPTAGSHCGPENVGVSFFGSSR